MMFKSTLIAAATAIAFSGAAIADGAKGPRVMTDPQLDGVIAGDVQVYAPFPASPLTPTLSDQSFSAFSGFDTAETSSPIAAGFARNEDDRYIMNTSTTPNNAIIVLSGGQ